MSAWLCSQNHINTLISYALDNDISLHPANDPEGLCRILTEENMRSLRSRYPERDFLDDWEKTAKDYKYERIKNIAALVRRLRKQQNDAGYCFGPLPTMDHIAVATQIVKACDCYDYQACESDDYYKTPTADFVSRVRDRAELSAAKRQSKTYDQLMWGLD